MRSDDDPPTTAELEYHRCWGLLGRSPPKNFHEGEDLSELLGTILDERKAFRERASKADDYREGLLKAREILEICKIRVQETLDRAPRGAATLVLPGDLHKLEDALDTVNKSLTR